jgi:hypothetical protein
VLPDDNFPESHQTLVYVNTTLSLVTLVVTFIMDVIAYAKYRHLSYDRLTPFVLALFLVSFSIRFTGYVI